MNTLLDKEKYLKYIKRHLPLKKKCYNTVAKRRQTDMSRKRKQIINEY